MTRKDFRLMAARLSEIQDLEARKTAAAAFVVVAKQANARFNSTIFYTACGL